MKIYVYSDLAALRTQFTTAALKNHIEEIVLARDSSGTELRCLAQICAALGDGQELPSEIVWMPKGVHRISAFNAEGKAWVGDVVCDEAGARSVIASFEKVVASGRRVYLDENHEDAAATAWVKGFSWDPARGIVAKVEWTSLGNELLKGRVYHSFSPEFLVNKETKRVTALVAGHAAGGLVNAPAFGAAMPALIAARLAGAESSANSAPDGSSGNNQTKSTMKEKLIALLAALAVQHDAAATEEQLTALVTANAEALRAKASTNETLKAQLAEYETLKAKAAADQSELVQLRAREVARRKADAEAAVKAAVARGALPPKDEAIQAKWRGLIEANPDHAQLLEAMPGNDALKGRVTNPTIVVQAKDGLIETLRALKAMKAEDVEGRALVYAREVAPCFKEESFELFPILAANSLATLGGELVTQRSLSLLKRSFPALFSLSTDFSDENADYNQTIKTRLRTIPTVTSYDADTGYADSDAATSDVPLTINAHKAVQIAFGANERSSTKRDLFGEQVEGAHNAIGADLIDAVLALITAGNFPAATHTSTIALNDFARTSVGAIRKKLVARKCRGDLSLFLNTDYHTKLGEDSAIVSLAAYQKPEVITDGQLPRISKMQPIEVEDMPTTGNLVGFGCRADALAVATRLPNNYADVMGDVASNGVIQTVRNLDTGISVMLVRFVDHLAGKARWRLAYMRGVAKGNPACGERIISAAP